MPLYEYACTSCERQFEVMQRFADDPLTICEECGGALKKLLSAPAFQFKGSGWYVTDYANKGKDDASKSDDGNESSKSDAKSDGGDKKTESKSDTSTDKGSSSKKEKTPTKSSEGKTSGSS